MINKVIYSYNILRIISMAGDLLFLDIRFTCCLIWYLIRYMVTSMGINTFSYLLVFLLFQISHRVIESKTFISLHSLWSSKTSAKTQSRSIVKFILKAVITIFWISSHISTTPSHSYKRWSKFSSCIQHILHFPSDNDILCKRLSVFIWPWNNFQLKSLHCLGNKSLTKLFWNQTIHLLSILSNLCSQYSFEGIWTVLLYKTMLYRSFDDNLFKGLWSPFGNLNVASNIARSCGFPFSFKIKDLKQPCEKYVFIVCNSNIYPALFFNLW